MRYFGPTPKAVLPESVREVQASVGERVMVNDVRSEQVLPSDVVLAHF
jgi:hypothetical protein